MKSKKSRRYILAISGGLAASSLSWAATSGDASTSVSLLGGDNNVPSGQVAQYTEMSDTLSHTRGSANVTSGIGLYEIDIPSNIDSSNLQITIIFTNLNELSGILDNPNAWIEVAVYEEDSTNPDETIGSRIDVSQDPGASASTRLTKQHAQGTLSPTISRDKLYIAATVKVPGGFPPGQQDSSLEFFIDIRTI